MKAVTTLALIAAGLLATTGLPGTAAHAALSITANTNVAAGMTAFGAATPLLTWANAFAPGANWTTGVFGGPAIIGNTTATDSATGAQAAANIYLTNWLDGVGFDKGALATPDLAINGVENFGLTFAAPVSRIGFAVASGLGLLPSEIASSGTSFSLTTNTGDSGSFSLVDTGAGVVAWIDIIAASPFTSISFTETGGDLTDQYFGNIVSGTAPVTGGVPEPAAWAMLIAGMGGVGAAMRRRRSGQRAVSA
jgi:hypothetical protein